MLPQKHWVQDRVTETRRTSPYGGIDHGSEGVVLAELRREGKVARKLVWFKGHEAASTGIRGMGRTYHPARLSVLNHIGLSEGHIFGYSDLNVESYPAQKSWCSRMAD